MYDLSKIYRGICKSDYSCIDKFLSFDVHQIDKTSTLASILMVFLRLYFSKYNDILFRHYLYQYMGVYFAKCKKISNKIINVLIYNSLWKQLELLANICPINITNIDLRHVTEHEYDCLKQCGIDLKYSVPYLLHNNILNETVLNTQNIFDNVYSINNVDFFDKLVLHKMIKPTRKTMTNLHRNHKLLLINHLITNYHKHPTTSNVNLFFATSHLSDEVKQNIDEYISLVEHKIKLSNKNILWLLNSNKYDVVFKLIEKSQTKPPQKWINRVVINTIQHDDIKMFQKMLNLNLVKIEDLHKHKMFVETAFFYKASNIADYMITTLNVPHIACILSVLSTNYLEQNSANEIVEILKFVQKYLINFPKKIFQKNIFKKLFSKKIFSKKMFSKILDFLLNETSIKLTFEETVQLANKSTKMFTKFVLNRTDNINRFSSDFLRKIIAKKIFVKNKIFENLLKYSKLDAEKCAVYALCINNFALFYKLSSKMKLSKIYTTLIQSFPDVVGIKLLADLVANLGYIWVTTNFTCDQICTIFSKNLDKLNCFINNASVLVKQLNITVSPTEFQSLLQSHKNGFIQTTDITELVNSLFEHNYHTAYIDIMLSLHLVELVVKINNWKFFMHNFSCRRMYEVFFDMYINGDYTPLLIDIMVESRMILTPAIYYVICASIQKLATNLKSIWWRKVQHMTATDLTKLLDYYPNMRNCDVVTLHFIYNKEMFDKIIFSDYEISQDEVSFVK